MKPQNPEFAKRAHEIFATAPFIAVLGIQLRDISPGQCVTKLLVTRKHLQQDQLMHAGV
ncbi:MAG: PaaI family thioesterase [bacterium]